MAKTKKKPVNINKEYPLFGWRLKKQYADELMEIFEEVEKAWNKAKTAPSSGYARNDLFYRAVKAGLENLKKISPK